MYHFLTCVRYSCIDTVEESIWRLSSSRLTPQVAVSPPAYCPPRRIGMAPAVNQTEANARMGHLAFVAQTSPSHPFSASYVALPVQPFLLASSNLLIQVSYLADALRAHASGIANLPRTHFAFSTLSSDDSSAAAPAERSTKMNVEIKQI